MIVNIIEIKEVINERDYTLLCANDSPTVDIKEFCYRILKIVGQIEDQAQAQKAAASENEVQETIPEEDQEEKPQG